MSCRNYRCSAILIALALVVGVGCQRGPSRVYPPSIDAGDAGSGAMSQYDKDGDGKVAGDELANSPALAYAVETIDTDGDRAVSAAEVAARVKKWQASRVGRMAFSCTVKFRGKPVEGATVTIEPEKYLGDEIQAATGKTDANGIAMLSIPVDPNNPDDVAGVQCGLYLVRISKEVNGQETVPPQYNTETTLGCEVALDSKDMEQGLVFDLK